MTLFAAELRRAMKDRGMTQAELSRRTGIHHSIICNWAKGRTLPAHDSVLRIADELVWDGLITRSIAARTAHCVVCGMPTVSFSRSHTTRQYCGSACQRAAYDRRHAKAKADEKTILRHRLQLFQEAVVANCNDCEPDGVCRNAAAPSKDEDCRFIDVTPFRYFEKRAKRA